MPLQNTKINSKKQLQINRGNTAETMLTKTGEKIKKNDSHLAAKKNCRSMFQIDYFICALFSFHLFLCILLLFSRLFFCYTIFNIYVFDVLRINFSFFAQPWALIRNTHTHSHTCVHTVYDKCKSRMCCCLSVYCCMWTMHLVSCNCMSLYTYMYISHNIK